MKFEVGDLVFCNDTRDYQIDIIDSIGKVVGFTKFDNTKVLLFDEKINKHFRNNQPEEMYEDGSVLFYPEVELTRVTVDNPINRKLYPDYEEFQGYLLPVEKVAVITESKE